jgi:hypothetical protein
MQSKRHSFWTYVVGLLPLGLILGAFELPLRRAYGDGLAFVGVIAYLLGLRLLGRYVKRLIR